MSLSKIQILFLKTSFIRIKGKRRKIMKEKLNEIKEDDAFNEKILSFLKKEED